MNTRELPRKILCKAGFTVCAANGSTLNRFTDDELVSVLEEHFGMNGSYVRRDFNREIIYRWDESQYAWLKPEEQEFDKC